MRRYCFVILLIWTTSPLSAQRVRVIKFPELKGMFAIQNDTTYVFNFFATWCDPCVAEFPNFQHLSDSLKSQKLRVIFVSLDFKNRYKSKLLPFLKRHHVTNEVLLLDEASSGNWIDDVDTNWSGGLPATLIVNNGLHERQLFARDFTYPALFAALEPFLH